MDRPGIETLLADGRRRLARRHRAIAVASATLAVAATLAVRYDAAGGDIAGPTGWAVAALEIVFIAGIIPLVVSAIYYGASAALLARGSRERIPQARLRGIRPPRRRGTAPGRGCWSG
jgi:hypothetical protein